jgi:hypothetical protein
MQISHGTVLCIARQGLYIHRIEDPQGFPEPAPYLKKCISAKSRKRSQS